MVMKNDEKKGKIGFVVGLKSVDFNADKFPKSEFVAAQFSRNPILGKNSSKMGVDEGAFSDVKTEHGKPETGHLQIKIGPAEQ